MNFISCYVCLFFCEIFEFHIWEQRALNFSYWKSIGSVTIFDNYTTCHFLWNKYSKNWAIFGFRTWKQIALIFPIEKALTEYFFVGNSANDHFSEKLFFWRTLLSHNGSYDTGLKFVSRLGAEKKCGHTDRQILSIIYRLSKCSTYYLSDN
jgi:hypothetical protein